MSTKANDKTNIYASHGSKQQLIGKRAIVNGKKSIAYVKDNELIAYEPIEELMKQLLKDGPCLTFKTM